MVSAQRNGGASVIAFTFSGIDATPTPTPRLMLLLILLHKQVKKAFNGRRDDDISICFDGCPVIFNTHTILLTKSIASIEN